MTKTTNDSDMIYHKKKGINNSNIQSGGMDINSILLANGGSMGSSMSGGSVSNMLGDLIVPAGLIYLQEHLNKRIGKEDSMTLHNEPVPDSLYDKLLGLEGSGTSKNKKKKTRKRDKKENSKKSNSMQNSKSNKKKTRK